MTRHVDTPRTPAPRGPGVVLAPVLATVLAALLLAALPAAAALGPAAAPAATPAAPPAPAAAPAPVHTIELTRTRPADGAVVELVVGDVVTIVNRSRVERTVRATAGDWTLGEGGTALAPGEATEPVTLAAPGRYAFVDHARVHDREVFLDASPAVPATPTPTRTPIAAPTATTQAPSAPRGPTRAPTPPEDEDPGPRAGGGDRAAGPAPRPVDREAEPRTRVEQPGREAAAREAGAGEQVAREQADRPDAPRDTSAGSGTTEQTPSGRTGGTGVAQAPALGVASSAPASPPAVPLPAVAPAPVVAGPALLVGQGSPSPAPPGLAGPETGRRLGLPVTVAVVALVGAASLVVRVLLAEPRSR